MRDIMAGFQRFISYLYQYENDSKQQNTGFAKVEVRGGTYRLEVHIRNLNLEKPDCIVYLFARKGEIMQGVPMGEIQIRRGSGDAGYMFGEKDLSDFGLTMDEMEGIFIALSEDLYIASQWKEGEILRQNLHVLKKKETPKPEEQGKEPREGLDGSRTPFRKPADADTAQTADVAQTANTARTAGATQTADTAQAAGVTQMADAESQSRNVARAAGQPEAQNENLPGEGEGISDTKGKQDGENLKATEIPLEKFMPDGDLEGTFQKLRLKLSVFFPFQGEEIECVKVDITDLQELPKKYWYLGKNSFLLHGFFNYRHLIIGEIKTEEKKEYFIGIPGVFQNQERIMATMFGFPEFRTAEQSEYKTGNFGYWYRIM